MILDASVAVKLLVREEGSLAAHRLVGLTSVAAPTLLCSEVANTLWKKRRRGELLGDVDLTTLVLEVSKLVDLIDEVPLMGRALEIAVLADHPVDDCVYLALAERMGDQLVTADRRFLAAVGATPFADRVRALA